MDQTVLRLGRRGSTAHPGSSEGRHIPQRFEADDVARALETRDRKFAALEAELGRLHDELAATEKR